LARKATLLDPELGKLTHDRLTRDVWVFQREKGHRFSSDDVVTALVATRTVPHARRILDLGCGLGSVLLTLAWTMPEAVLVGIEAQAMSFELLRRNLEGSGYAARVRIVQGDLRDSDAIATLGANFDLITGTPPYFPPSSALDAEDEQRAFARIEYRGGVEAYVKTAVPLLATDGKIVLCGDARATERVRVAAASSNTSIRARCDVIPREGQPPLFSVWTLEQGPGTSEVVSCLVLRDAAGGRTSDAQRLREFSGF
jgi:tRNA1Val (adenine37-N6)-methyltransferase